MTQLDLFTKPGSPLDDTEVRKAVLAAINPALGEDAFGQYAPLAKSVYPKSMLDPKEPIEFPADLDAAKATIKKHGPVSLSIGLHSAQPTYQRAADLMIAQMALIGVKAAASVLPSGAAYALKGDAKAPDLLLTIASPDAGHPRTRRRSSSPRDAQLNFYGKSVPEADALVDQAGLTTDIAKRRSLAPRPGDVCRCRLDHSAG